MTKVADRPATRRETRRQTRREAIVEVAARWFLEHGYGGTTMSAVAGALGGSKGTLWSYFPSKEALFIAVLDQVTENYRAQVSLILDPRHELVSALRRFCREFVRKLTSPEGIALYRLIVSEAGRFPEIGRIFHDRGPRATHEQLAAFLANAMERGLIRRDDPLEAARQLIGLFMSGSRQSVLIGLVETVGAAEIEHEVDCAMDTFMRAYAID